jgi:hypothetical protein
VKLISSAAVLFGALAHLALAQVAVLHIQIIEGEGAVNATGSHTSRPLVVEVTDETGRPVEGASVSFHLPEEGPGGAFGNGLRTDVTVTDARGRANLHSMQLNRTPGRFAIRIVASKEQARAGMVSFQYIAEPKSGAVASSSAQNGSTSGLPSGLPLKSGSSFWHGPLKWVAIGALAAGAATAGALLAGKSGGAASTGSAPTAPAGTITIGSPTLTVGKP